VTHVLSTAGEIIIASKLIRLSWFNAGWMLAALLPARERFRSLLAKAFGVHLRAVDRPLGFARRNDLGRRVDRVLSLAGGGHLFARASRCAAHSGNRRNLSARVGRSVRARQTGNSNPITKALTICHTLQSMTILGNHGVVSLQFVSIVPRLEHAERESATHPERQAGFSNFVQLCMLLKRFACNQSAPRDFPAPRARCCASQS
jgi:hypothetical protein